VTASNDLHILIVDDEEELLLFLKTILSEEGFKVTSASGGEEAFTVLDSQSFDLALVDMVMPGIDGSDVLRLVTQHFPDTAVIMMTGYSDTSTVVTALREGADDFLIKPFEIQELLFRIHSVIDRRRVKREQEEMVKREKVLLNQLSDMNKSLLKEIDQRRRAKEELHGLNNQLEERIRERTEELEEANSALKVLIRERDRASNELNDRLMINLRETVLPLIERLKTYVQEDNILDLISRIERNIIDITRPFLRVLSSMHTGLTRTELQVANRIAQGKTTKEIASLMNISVRTVEAHRRNIRKKLGLNNKDENLTTYLLSLTDGYETNLELLRKENLE
jgi:DNA-binding NarL/FixJ family response regulator